MQNAAGRILTRPSEHSHTTPIMASLYLLLIQGGAGFKLLPVFNTWLALNGLDTPYLVELLTPCILPRPLHSELLPSGHYLRGPFHTVHLTYGTASRSLMKNPPLSTLLKTHFLPSVTRRNANCVTVISKVCLFCGLLVPLIAIDSIQCIETMLLPWWFYTLNKPNFCYKIISW